MNGPTVAAVAVAMLASSSSVHAQWQKLRDPAVSRAGSEEPELAAPAPRTGGKPDLSGVWLPESDPLPEGQLTVEIDLELPRHFVNVAADLPEDAVPLQRWAADVLKERLASQGTEDPVAHCRPSGMPLVDAAPLPFKIVQTPDLVVILYEENSLFRQIFMNGRRPVEDAEPRYLGYSTGHWEGDELVVDTVGLNDLHWLDAMGHPLTEKLLVTERFHRLDAGHLEIAITLDDPGAYTAPINYTVKTALLPDDDLLEYFCTDNEKDIQHYQE